MTVVFKSWKRKTCLTIEFTTLDGKPHMKLDGCSLVPLSDVLWIES